MDFLPLAIWAVGMAYVMDNSKDDVDRKCVNFYVFGCVAFLLLGLISLF